MMARTIFDVLKDHFATNEYPVEEFIATDGYDRFEAWTGANKKYWEIGIFETARGEWRCTTRWGRVGNRPRDNTQVFQTRDGAESKYFRKVGEKMAEGYRRV